MKFEKLNSKKFEGFRKSSIINPSTIMGGRVETSNYHNQTPAWHDFFDWTNNETAKDNFVCTQDGQGPSLDKPDEP
jgi:hypothetical protein